MLWSALLSGVGVAFICLICAMQEITLTHSAVLGIALVIIVVVFIARMMGRDAGLKSPAPDIGGFHGLTPNIEYECLCSGHAPFGETAIVHFTTVKALMGPKKGEVRAVMSDKVLPAKFWVRPDRTVSALDPKSKAA